MINNPSPQSKLGIPCGLHMIGADPDQFVAAHKARQLSRQAVTAGIHRKGTERLSRRIAASVDRSAWTSGTPYMHGICERDGCHSNSDTTVEMMRGQVKEKRTVCTPCRREVERLTDGQP